MNKETFYDTIAENFDEIMSMYDTNRRIEVIFDDFLEREDLANKKLLDGGCGTGWFTKKAITRQARVTSIDIAEKLVKLTKVKCPEATCMQGSLLDLPFEDNYFDYVISSDVIEHTPDPLKSIHELVRVLKPGGKIVITVPNRTTWYFSLVLANQFGLRKYQGYENWVHYRRLKKIMLSHSLEVIDQKGIHLFPFVVKPLNKLLYRLDKIFARPLGILCVNAAIYAEKKDIKK